MNIEFNQQLMKKEREMEQMRDDYIKQTDDLKRKDNQIAHLENKMKQMEQSHFTFDHNEN